eukprot:13806993-Alexandrium_andersonii.AAC.1
MLLRLSGVDAAVFFRDHVEKGEGAQVDTQVVWLRDKSLAEARAELRLAPRHCGLAAKQMGDGAMALGIR